MNERPFPFANLKIALISDVLTRICLGYECRIMNVTPWNSAFVFRIWKPDLLLVESAWDGYWESWKYRIASYPDHPERNNAMLARVVENAKDRHIPTVFWNREDGVHFDRFIASAGLFDFVFTVDEKMLPHYHAVLRSDAKIDVLMFSAQPAIHFPLAVEPYRRVAFAGSYSRHLHAVRRQWQDMVFQASSEIGLTIYNRNSERRSSRYQCPSASWIKVEKAVAHINTADVYRQYVANLNVNTINNSPTAFSRRLVEIIASGGFAVTNTTPAIKRHFQDFCETVDDEEQARALFPGFPAMAGLPKIVNACVLASIMCSGTILGSIGCNKLQLW